MKIISYIIVEDKDITTFEQEVMQKINEGYELQGGVSVAVNSSTDNWFYHQALIKKEN